MLVRDENFDQKYVSKKNISIFLFCIYFPSTRTTSFSSQLHPPRWLEQKFYFHPLNHPLYYRAPAGVSPIFGATLLTFSELISWTEKSDDQKKKFFEHVGGIIHGEKMFGRCCGRSTRLKKYLLKTLQIIPEALRHLPGEGDLPGERDTFSPAFSSLFAVQKCYS